MTPTERAEMRRLERALAYSAARSDVESYCATVSGNLSPWYDPAHVLDDDHETVATAIRYLDLHGLIERSPQGWVRVRDAA